MLVPISPMQTNFISSVKNSSCAAAGGRIDDAAPWELSAVGVSNSIKRTTHIEPLATDTTDVRLATTRSDVETIQRIC